jgi:hypothetical protein
MMDSATEAAKREGIREIKTVCADAFDELRGIHKHIIMSEIERVDRDAGTCAYLLTLDMVRIEHRDKKIAKMRYKIFFACLEEIHEAFADLAPRKKLKPFMLEVKDTTGRVLIHLDLKDDPPAVP